MSNIRNNISVGKSDVVWSYLAKFLGIASGLLVLPVVLNRLSAEEIGLNYLMLTIGAMVGLLDFGFSPQFGRNITYAFSGAKTLVKEGFSPDSNLSVPNYQLVAIVIKTAKLVYRKLSLIVLVIMLTFGTVYIYKVTKGFVNVRYSLLIWIIYSFSIYFNVYYNYLSGLLTGRGMVKESSKSIILSKIVYVFLSVGLILYGCGLLSIVIANFVTPFVQRLYAYKVFYDDEMMANLPKNVTKEEVRETFSTIWYNAKKLGVVFVGAYVINKMNMFFVGLYLPLYETASYGLLVQLGTTMVTMASVFFVSFLPKFSNYQVTKEYEKLKELLAATMLLFWIIMITGSLIMFFWGEWLLDLIGSNTKLPSRWICLLYLIFSTLELNQSNFATIIVTSNRVPLVKPTLISGACIIVGTLLFLEFTDCGLLGVVVVQAVVQLAYNDWKWPLQVLRELHCDLRAFIGAGAKYLYKNIRKQG